MKFMRKPTVTEAVQFDGDPNCHPGIQLDRGSPFVVTAHEQRCFLAKGDWILPEAKPDRYYPVKHAVFRANYEPLPDSPPGMPPIPDSVLDMARKLRTWMVTNKGTSLFGLQRVG